MQPTKTESCSNRKSEQTNYWEIGSIIKQNKTKQKPPIKKKSRTRWFHGEICQTFKELIPIFSSSSKNRKGKNTSKLILQRQHYLDNKLDKDTRKKNYRPISMMNMVL